MLRPNQPPSFSRSTVCE